MPCRPLADKDPYLNLLQRSGNEKIDLKELRFDFYRKIDLFDRLAYSEDTLWLAYAVLDRRLGSGPYAPLAFLASSAFGMPGAALKDSRGLRQFVALDHR